MGGVSHRSPFQHIKPKVGIAPQTISSETTVNGTGVLVQGYYGLMAVVNATAGGASTVVTFKLQHSADNSNWADIAGATLSSAANTAISVGSPQVFSLDLINGDIDIYVRMVVTTAGGTPSTIVNGVLLLMGKVVEPV